MSIIKTEHLTHIYSQGTPYERAALQDFNIEMEEGEFAGIIGHTGSGKSTFIQHLNGLLAPTEGKVYAPIDGEITQAPDSGHALGIQGIGDVEVLIHVGVDTVEMKGDGFSPKVKVGDKIKKGDLLLEMDLTKIAAAGHPAVVITVITNTDDFAGVEVVASGTVEPGADLIKISK